MNKDILGELSKVDREIKSATAEKNQAEGARKSIITNMEKSYSVTTMPQAKQYVDDKDKELADLAQEIDSKFKDLQENYSW